MNKIEIIATFTALKSLQENKLYDEVMKVIEETLAAAKGETVKPKKAKETVENE